MDLTITIAPEQADALNAYLLTIPGEEYTDPATGNRIRAKRKYPAGLVDWLSERVSAVVADAISVLPAKPAATQQLDDQIAALQRQKEQLARQSAIVTTKA